MDQAGNTTEALCDALGYAGSGTFVMASDDLTDVGHDVREALSTLGMEGVFCVGDGFPGENKKALVYVARADDETSFAKLRREAWTQGVVPFVLIVKGAEVFVCNAFASPDTSLTGIRLPAPGAPLPASLSSFHAGSIGSSLAWSAFMLDRSDSVHGRLIRGIELLNDKSRRLFPHLENYPGLVNALIGKLVYLYVLVDRGILTREWLYARLPAGEGPGTQFVEGLFDGERRGDDWGAAQAFAVFDAIDREINGSVFEIPSWYREFIPDEVARLVHDVLRLGTLLSSTGRDGDQLSFLGLSYRVLRTETISAIYERFVTIEDKASKTADGIFYTPPHLVDHVLDRVEGVAPLDRDSRILDAAAGSGIFLVGAYRRLMERHMPVGGWGLGHFHIARQLLETCIHGLEKHPEAAAVARFSLQLTLLDYVGRGTIDELLEANGLRFLPDLARNIRVADAFDPEVAPGIGDNREFEGKYTHVIGNPPWSTTSGQRDRSNERLRDRTAGGHAGTFKHGLKAAGIEVNHSRMADLFVWLAARKLARPEAVIALVLPTKSLVGRHADLFATHLAKQLSVVWVSNLSHLRRKLFVGVEAAATVMVAINRKPRSTDRAAIYRPLLPSLPGGRSNEVWRLLASPAEIRIRPSERIADGPNGWMSATMLSELDARMRDALSVYAATEKRTFGDFVRRSGLLISKGGSPSESGIHRADGPELPPMPIYPLTPRRFLQVTAGYRGFFAGNSILMPRSMQMARYYPGPVAYSSTFNGIVPEEQYRRGLSGLGALRTDPMDPRSVDALLAYLNSGVLRYFAALFGATYLIDGTRVEKRELLEMPCPFVDFHDSGFQQLAEAADVDAAILDALEAGTEFRASFREHRELRAGFGNSKVPGKSLLPPSQDELELYLDRLRPELQSALNTPVSLERRTVGGTGLGVVGIGLDTAPRAPAGSPPPGKYIGSSMIEVDRTARCAWIYKSPLLYAWTIDQAVSDAIAVVRSLRG